MLSHWSAMRSQEPSRLTHVVAIAKLLMRGDAKVDDRGIAVQAEDKLASVCRVIIFNRQFLHMLVIFSLGDQNPVIAAEYAIRRDVACRSSHVPPVRSVASCLADIEHFLFGGRELRLVGGFGARSPAECHREAGDETHTSYPPWK